MISDRLNRLLIDQMIQTSLESTRRLPVLSGPSTAL